jgi:hypothetical protein
MPPEQTGSHISSTNDAGGKEGISKPMPEIELHFRVFV